MCRAATVPFGFVRNGDPRLRPGTGTQKASTAPHTSMEIGYGEAFRYGLGLIVYIIAIGLAAGAVALLGFAIVGGAGLTGSGDALAGAAFFGGLFILAGYGVLVAGMLGMQYKVAAEGSARALEEAGVDSTASGPGGGAELGGRGSEAELGSRSGAGQEGEF